MRRFILIDHSLIDYSGHHYEYARAVLNAAHEAGYQPLLFTNRRFRGEYQEAWPIVPAYQYGVWLHQGPRWRQQLHRGMGAARSMSRRLAPGRGGEKSDPADQNKRWGNIFRARLQARQSRQFVHDTRRALRRFNLAAHDLVFTPNISLNDFAALRRSWPIAGPSSGGRWHFVFRRDVPLSSSQEAKPLSEAFGACPALDRDIPWRLWTDSEELSARYCKATGRAFDTLPIPHTQVSRTGAQPANRLRVLYLGDARSEKGFQHLPRLVRALTDAERDGRTFEFYFQAHAVSPSEEPQVVAARAELTKLASRGVKLFTAPLAPNEYRELLSSGHLAVLPYDPLAYAARSSGVFAEALSAGIPPVVPDQTWMARRLPAGAGRSYSAVERAADAILDIARDYDRHAETAQRSAIDWRAEHNARRLVALLGESSKAAATFPPMADFKEPLAAKLESEGAGLSRITA